ncbi:MAG: PilZ domain-containing protein [Acidobacteria bacterium]|nr:PilZ domain-containing protein [Acidobacteriota bacterium]
MTEPNLNLTKPLSPVDDRRTEPRFAANGVVTLYVDKTSVRGRMTDVSEHGMRVEHMYAELSSGMILELETGGTRRTARVVWNRIRNEGVESGFYLL